jgi:hypothetical protein
MANTHSSIATDSATELSRLVGDDSTATFENDPTFVDANPGAAGSSENVEEQRAEEDTEDSDEEIEDEGAEDDADVDDDDLEDDDEEDEADEVGAVAVANR